MRKPHLDLFAFPMGLLEGVRVGQSADAIANILVEVAGDFAPAVVHRGFKAQAEQSFLLAL